MTHEVFDEWKNPAGALAAPDAQLVLRARSLADRALPPIKAALQPRTDASIENLYAFTFSGAERASAYNVTAHFCPADDGCANPEDPRDGAAFVKTEVGAFRVLHAAFSAADSTFSCPAEVTVEGIIECTVAARDPFSNLLRPTEAMALLLRLLEPPQRRGSLAGLKKWNRNSSYRS